MSSDRRLRLTLNDEQRVAGRLATAVCVVLFAPAAVLVMLACLLIVAACLLALPALAIGWVLSRA